VAHLAGTLGEVVQDRPLFQPGAGEKVAVLLVASDRGLCGAYNTNLFRILEATLKTSERTHDFFVYGRKGHQYLTKRGREVTQFFVEPELEKIDYRGAVHVAKALCDAFLSGEYREVRVLYTAFESMVKYVPTWVDFLPVQSSSLSRDVAAEGESQRGGDVILEPDAATIFDQLVPRYLETRIYNALVESLTSEYASRRVSMKNATEAAGDMQSELKGIYNRKRQEGITKDLLDIVGGAEAVR